MATTYDIDALRAAGMTEDAIRELMAFDLAKYQADYRATQDAITKANEAAYAKAAGSGISNINMYENAVGAGEIIPGSTSQIMQGLGMYTPQYQAVMRTYGSANDKSNENDVTERSTFAVNPDADYRLVDAKGNVIGSTEAGNSVRSLVDYANTLSEEQGSKANWRIEATNPLGNWNPVAEDTPMDNMMADLKPLIQAAVVMAAVGTGLAAVTAPAAGATGAGAAAAGAGTGAGAAGTGSLVSSSALASSTASNLAAISKAASSAASAAGLTGASTSLLADVGLSALRGGLTSAAMGGDPLTGALTAGLGELGSQVVGPLIQSQEVGRIGAGGNFILDGTREATRLGSAAGTALGSATGSLIAGESLKDIALTGGISGLSDYLTYKPSIKGEQLVGGVNQADLDTDLLDISDSVFNDLKDTGVFSSMNTRVIDNALDDILVNAATQTEKSLNSLFTNVGSDALTNAPTSGDVFVYGQEQPTGGSMDNTLKGIGSDILVTGAKNNGDRGRDTTVSPEDIFVNGVRVTTSPTSQPTTQAPTITVTARPTTMATTSPTTQAPTITVTARPTTAPTTSPTTQAPTITVTARPTTAPTTAPTTQAPTITVTARPTTAPTTAPTTQAPTITVTARPTTAATTQSPTVSPTYPTYPPTQPPTWGTKDWVLLGLAMPNLINRVVGKGEDVGTISTDKSAVTYNPLNRQRNTGTFDPFTYGQKGIGYQSEEFEFFKPYTMAQPEQKSTSASVTYTPGADIYEYTPAEFEKMKADANAQYAARSAAFNNFQQTLAKQVESGAMTLEQAQAEARAYAEPFGGAIIQQKADGGYIGYADGGEADDDMVKHLMEYRKGGGHTGPGPVRGIGSGQEDKIPAWLSDGEYVWSAQDVADLGDGSTDEGVRRLDKMRQMVRKQAGRKDVKKIAKPQKGIDHMLKAVGGRV